MSQPGEVLEGGAPDPIEWAKKLAEDPGHHSDCCPRCRQAIAETWAYARALNQIGSEMGAMMTGAGAGAPGGLGGWIAGLFGRKAMKRMQGLSEASPDHALVPVHAHPETEEWEGFEHGHLGGDEPHEHEPIEPTHDDEEVSVDATGQ